MQPAIRTATGELLDALLNLRLKADKTLLQSVLAQTDQIDLSLYSEESVARYLAARADAASVNDQDLSQEEQAVVDSVVKNLQDALAALEAVSVDNQNTAATTPAQGDTSITANAAQPKTGDQAPFAGIAAVALLSLAGVSLLRKRSK